MIVREVRPKSILSNSKVHDYVVNPYVGCQHGCSYCYARFMKRFTGHTEPWGQFVDVKVNAAELLRTEVRRKKRGTVWVSGVCDPYQPVEARYGLTRECLRILAENDWPVVVQTRSPLILRDVDILLAARELEAGLTVTTADDEVRKLFEPHAPPIGERLRALEELHRRGIRTYAMIAPMLPGAEALPEALRGKVGYVLLDRMNYHYADWVYRKHGLEGMRSGEFFHTAARAIAAACAELGVPCRGVA